MSEVLETPVITLLDETVVESKVYDLKAISEKLEIINFQLSQKRTPQEKYFIGYLPNYVMLYISRKEKDDIIC